VERTLLSAAFDLDLEVDLNVDLDLGVDLDLSTIAEPRCRGYNVMEL